MPTHDHDNDAPRYHDGPQHKCIYEHPAQRDDNCTACLFACHNNGPQRAEHVDPFLSFLNGVARDCINGRG